ncbi:MAG: type VI secretion system-associated FHA domain protein TagH [Gammaproteobacteria bacterium]
MNLILEVIGRAGGRPDTVRRKVFGLEGGRIGRASDCDWVLADPYVSRHHATVYCINGTFYIESTGENGVALNGPQSMLPQLQRQSLKSGDRLYIDEHEISVVILESPPPLAPVDGPLDVTAELLDPLAQLAGGAPGPAPSALPGVAWNASSSLADHFTPPRAAPGTLAVAEDWDDASPDSTSVQMPPSRPAPVMPPPMPAPVSPFPTPRTPNAREQLDIESLLRQFGIDTLTVPLDTLNSMSSAVRAVLQGLIDVLRERAQFRSQFHIQGGRISATESNPLKFAINAQDALASLFGARGLPITMTPAQAFAEAFDDMRMHQQATLAGIQAGFESVLARFDPDALQERFDRHLKRAGFLPLAAKFRYWDLYVELFEDMSADPNSTFQRMFGEAFTGAYEKRLEDLQGSRRKPAS